MPGYLITQIAFTAPPTSGSQYIAIFHKVTSEPDSTYVQDGTHIEVAPDGMLIVPFQISGLDFDENYTIKVVNECGGQEDTTTIQTPPIPCPDIIGIGGASGFIHVTIVSNLNASSFGTFNGMVQNNNLQIIQIG